MTNPPRPDQPRPIRADEPMDCMAFKSRSEEWLRPLEPPAASGILVRHAWCGRPNVSLIWRQTQIANGSTSIVEELQMVLLAIINRFRPNRVSLTACSIRSRPNRCAAALRAGLDPICARRLQNSTLGTKRCSSLEQRGETKV
jgi:hypothetical protein